VRNKSISKPVSEMLQYYETAFIKSSLTTLAERRINFYYFTAMIG